MFARLLWWLTPGHHETPSMIYDPMARLLIIARLWQAGFVTVNELRSLYGLR